MCEGPILSLKVLVGVMMAFPVKVGLNQGPALSCYLFALIMDNLTSVSKMKSCGVCC